MRKEKGEKSFFGIRKDIAYISIALIAVGLVFVIFPETSTEAICRIIAAVLCLWGAVTILGYFRLSRFDVLGSYGLVKGAVFAMAGIFILIKPAVMAEFLVAIIGFIMIADGFLKVQHAVDLLRIKSHTWLGLMILAVVMIAAGGVVIFNPFHTAKILMMFAGIIMIVEGVTDLASVLFISRKIGIIRRAMEEDAVIVEQAEETVE